MTISIQKNFPSSSLSCFGTGGPIFEFITTDKFEEFVSLWIEGQAEKIPQRIIGSGSNILFPDKGFSGRIYKFLARKIKIKKQTARNLVLECDAGVQLRDLVLLSSEKGFANILDLFGIPGTVGGAVFGNAGAWNAQISDNLLSLTLCDSNGNQKILAKKNITFAYRHSSIKNDKVILSAVFNFHKTQSVEKNRQILSKKSRLRLKKTPLGKHCGSFFKNIYNKNGKIKFFAGKILEDLGAKGDRVGGAEISSVHANCIINTGSATSKDILDLAQKWQNIAKKKNSQFALEPEVQIIE